MDTSRQPDTPAARGATDMRTPRIFVSHSHHDEAFALRLAADFERAGAYVWIDKHDIKQGDFLKRISEGLAQCDWLVLVETTDSLTSEAVEMEVNAALMRVLYHQMRGVLRCIAAPRDAAIVPALWGPLQYYDATVDYAAAVRETLAAIRDGDARWAARHPASATPIAPVASPSAAPTSPAAGLIARIVTAYTENDWHAVIDRSDLLRSDRLELMTVEVWRMRGRALLELARPAEASAALKAAYDLDTYDLPTVRAYARAERAQGHDAEAEPLYKRAMALADDNETRLDILREYVPTLQALGRWDDALSRTDEALKLRPDDPSWQRQRLTALTHLNRVADAQALAQQIATRPDGSATDWLAFAQAIRAAHPSPADEASDANTRAQITRALDAADRLATRTVTGAPGQPAADPTLAAAIANARRTLLPPPAPPIPADRFPARLASLGFVARKLNGVEVIVPPLSDIPAGPFLMGSNSQEDNAAKPQHTVTLAAYQIARYPVTVAEYACAVRAGAVSEPTQGSWRPITWQEQLKRLDHPIVCVSWNDAIAYVAWLAKTTGQPWRLPTEAEWEKAARGTDGRVYPWGNGWDKTRANTSDGGPGATTPVGTYPSGASPYGAQDMAGNVWEWTNTLYKPYPYSATDGREDRYSTGNRILRGGSWDDGPQVARAVYRYVNGPVVVVGGDGFRVVVSALAH